MISTATTTKSVESEKPSAQYSRLQKLLSFRFFDQPSKATQAPAPQDDFIDIVLEADFSSKGKVRSIR
jgi:hypothetical protein